MQPSFKRIGVFGGFAVMLILLVGNAFVTRRRVDVQTGIESLVSHTHEVLFELKQTELLLLTAEAGKRGYLYTGDVRYLFPYKDAIVHLDPQLDTIARLTADNPRQQALIPGLRNLINEKVFEMAETIELYQSGEAEAARDLVLTDTSRGTMDQISLTISQMESEETSLESSRMASYQRSVRRTIASIYLASLLATVGLVFLAYYILREIKLREKHSLEIREREEWFRVTLTSIGDAVIATDKDGTVAFLNPVAEDLTGNSFGQSKGKNVGEIFLIFNERTDQPAENPVQNVLEKGHVVGLANHTVLKRSDGTQIPIEDSAAPIRNARGELLGVILVFRDATNERKATEIMRKTERLAAAARLTANMAHEINNPLQAVESLIYLAKSMPGAPEDLVEQLDVADQELKRVAHIAQQALGFYRESPAAEMIDIPGLVNSVLALYTNKFQGKDIRVECNYDGCPPVEAVLGELKQVLANLLANAADAVGKQGTITLTFGAAEEDGRTMLRILVEDDGPGIPPEAAQHLFEPFFTTKRDVGTGLGLWLTKEILERHGGSIEFLPRDRGVNGAVFRILLPSKTSPAL